MGSPAPLPTKLSASLISVVAWAAALAALWQLRRRRLRAGRILLLVAGTLLAFASAVSDARTLASSQLVTTLDPALTRTGIALTLSLGLGMVRKLSTSVRQVDQGLVVSDGSSSGLLIHATVGSWGGVGGLRTNRSGWVV